jgi:prepilin peptidase CpaA
VLSVLAASVGVSAVIDVKTRRVPNVLTAAIACTGLALAATGRGDVAPAAAVGGLVIGVLIMLPGHLFGATGAGDVKLLGALGTLLGPIGVITAFLYTAIAGGALAVLVAVRRRSLTATLERAAALAKADGAASAAIREATTNNRFAYAPAIAVGTMMAALRG